MKLTRNLKIYIVLSLIISGLVFWLSIINDFGIQTTNNADGTTTITSSMPLIWVGLLAVSFFVLYKSDSKRGTRANLGFAYHAATTVIVLIPIMVLLVVSDFDVYALIPLVALTLSLAIHWFFTRKDPKGLEGKKVFR